MQINTHISLKKLLAATLLSACFNTHGAIIDHGSYLSDSATGLDWLDVLASVNRSFNDVSSHFGAGGDYEGWRYASGLQFNTLLYNWTGVAPAISGRTITTGTTPSVDGLVILFGSTLDSWWVNTSGRTWALGNTWDSAFRYAEGAGQDYTLGILADTVLNNPSQIQVAGIWDSEVGNKFDFYDAQHQNLPLAGNNPAIGSFLVRDTPDLSNGSNSPPTSVGEPHSLILLGLGLIGLGLARRRL